MAGSLNHSPADVVRKLLITLELGHASPPTSADQWPIYVSAEPTDPDNVITLYDTEGRSHGRVHNDGERQEHHGFQVRVRARTHPLGYAKAKAIAETLDTGIYQEVVTMPDDTHYLVHAVSRGSDVLPIGFESPTSKRVLFTINALVALRQVEE